MFELIKKRRVTSKKRYEEGKLGHEVGEKTEYTSKFQIGEGPGRELTFIEVVHKRKAQLDSYEVRGKA